MKSLSSLLSMSILITIPTFPLRICNSCPEKLHIIIEIPQISLLFNGTLAPYTATNADIHTSLLGNDSIVLISIIPPNNKSFYGPLTQAKTLRPEDEIIISYKIDSSPRVAYMTATTRSEIPMTKNSFFKRSWFALKNKLKEKFWF